MRGTAGTALPDMVYSRDHPRACGEQCPLLSSHGSTEGSPPRVRGTAWVWIIPPVDTGITPARAGNSKNLTLLERSTKDHPRACGEQNAGNQAVFIDVGSPPRVRGTAFHRAMDEAIAADHPRACGEQELFHVLKANQLGSPPRVRGTAVLAESKRQNEGITPARAGNSRYVRLCSASVGDHPRACGEQGKRQT